MAKFPEGLPPWTQLFLQAARRMDVLEKRQENGTHVTAENTPKPAKRAKTKKTKKGKSKTTKKRNAKAKPADDVVEEEADDGLRDDVEDEVMAAAAEGLLVNVSKGKSSVSEVLDIFSTSQRY